MITLKEDGLPWEKESHLEISRKFSGELDLDGASKVLKTSMTEEHQQLFNFVLKCVLPRGERRHLASFLELTVMHLLDTEQSINLPSIMIQHIGRVISMHSHALPYGYLLTMVFKHFKVPLGKGEPFRQKDQLDFGLHRTLQKQPKPFQSTGEAGTSVTPTEWSSCKRASTL
ncbi:hypothetical protein Dimus_038149 [Dionaea muscipula]